MNIIAALKALSPAIGDGKIVRVHSHVACDSTYFYVTDGRQNAIAPCDALPKFCVHAASLQQAVSREGATLSFDDATSRLVVKYRGERGRLRIASEPFEAMPTVSMFPSVTEPRLQHRIPDGFLACLRRLKTFVGAPDGQPWSTSIHFGHDYSFAASNAAFARDPYILGLPNPVHIPPWAFEFILAQDAPPLYVYDLTRSLHFEWQNGVALNTRLLEDPSEAVWNLVGDMGIVEGFPVPDGLKEAVTHAKEHGVTSVQIGAGVVKASYDFAEFEEDIAYDGEQRDWNVAMLLQALEYAEQLDLSGAHARWSGAGLRGVVAGMSRRGS